METKNFVAFGTGCTLVVMGALVLAAVIIDTPSIIFKGFLAVVGGWATAVGAIIAYEAFTAREDNERS